MTAAASTVFVRWCGKPLQGTLRGHAFPDGTPCMRRMLSVEIPVQGVKILAAFTPEHIYDTAEKAGGSVSEAQQPAPEASTEVTGTSLPFAQAFSLGLARSKYKAFMQSHWDHDRNRLRTDCLQEFMRLFDNRMIEEARAKGFTIKETPPPPRPALSRSRPAVLPQEKKKQPQVKQLSLF
jgi:hypothetical protein